MYLSSILQLPLFQNRLRLRNPEHVNRWQCVNRVLGFIPMRWVTGPEVVDLQLLEADLEVNLFDLDAFDFSAMSKLERAAIELPPAFANYYSVSEIGTISFLDRGMPG